MKEHETVTFYNAAIFDLWTRWDKTILQNARKLFAQILCSFSVRLLSHAHHNMKWIETRTSRKIGTNKHE